MIAGCNDIASVMGNELGIMQVKSWKLHRHAVVVYENRSEILLLFYRFRIDEVLALGLAEVRVAHAVIAIGTLTHL